MKVLCIDGVKAGTLSTQGVFVATKDDEIYEGEIYTVSHDYQQGFKYPCYSLVERGITTYLKRRFMPISNIEENEKELCKVNEPTHNR